VLAPDGIRVNAIAPGAIPGGGFVADNLGELIAQIPLGRAGTPDDIAQVAVAVLRKDLAVMSWEPR
jgi:NAD(P)-dependent dehydrogenase (short-subunit alcohol dehydrogenase family)